jgi:truncated hemoglobin YjbI
LGEELVHHFYAQLLTQPEIKQLFAHTEMARQHRARAGDRAGGLWEGSGVMAADMPHSRQCTRWPAERVEGQCGA